MTALVARLVAAIQQVRQQTPHAATCATRSAATLLSYACTCDREQRVDARLAACVEAAMQETAEAAIPHYGAHGEDIYESFPVICEAGLAAFLAAAAQKETAQ